MLGSSALVVGRFDLSMVVVVVALGLYSLIGLGVWGFGILWLADLVLESFWAWSFAEQLLFVWGMKWLILSE